MATPMGKRIYVPHVLGDQYYEKLPRNVPYLAAAKGFANDTTSHGIPHIAYSKGFLKIFIWAILTLGAYAGWIWNTYIILDEFLLYDTTISVSIKSVRNMTFPAVTVCNLNPYRQSKVDNTVLYTVNGSFFNDSVNVVTDPWEQQRIQEGFGSRSSHYQVEEDIYEYVSRQPPETKENWGHKLTDFVLECQYQGYSCNYASFEYFHNWKYGNCWVYNSGKNATLGVRTATNTGPRYGLELLLNLEQSEYIGELADRAGARIVVHDQAKMPFPDEEGISVSPGTATEIGLRKIKMSRLGGNYGSCIETQLNHTDINIYEEIFPWTNFTTKACFKTCYQKAVMSTCKCHDPRYPNTGIGVGGTYGVPTSLKPCSSRNATEALCQHEVETLFIKNKLSCPCSDPLCNETAIAVTFSTSDWPSENYQQMLLDDLRLKSPSAKTIVDAGKHKTNFALIDIYYEELNYEALDESAAYPNSQFFADIGGAVGLWIGASLLTLFEYFELGIDLLVIACWKMGGRSEKNAVNDEPESPEESKEKPAIRYTNPSFQS